MQGKKGEIEEILNESTLKLWNEYIEKLNNPYKYLSNEAKIYIEEAKRTFGNECEIIITPLKKIKGENNGINK